MKDEEKKEWLSEEESESTEMGEAAKSTAEVAKALKTSKIITIISAFVAVVAVATVALVFGGKDDGNHTHSFGEWSITKASACENDGVKERYCDCGEKQTLAIEATGHIYGSWTVVEEATCANEGSEKRECECGKKETRSIDKINTHTEVIDQAVDATCTSPGRTEGKHCSVCNKVFVEQMETPVKPHTYDDEYDGNCNDCGFEIIPACRHDNPVVLAGKEPTCTDTGLTEGKKCADCDEILVAQTTIKANGHTEGSWIIDKSATCLVEGKKHQECSVCNATIDEAKIDPLGHTEGAWIIDKNATCTENGSKHKNCSVCGDKLKTETISKLNHVDSDWIYDKNPTCTESGARHKVCTKCNNIFGSEIVSALGHRKGSAISEGRIEATCTEDGYYYEVFYCFEIGCNYEFSRVKKTIDALRHNYSDGYCTRCSAEDPYPGAIRIYTYSDLVNIKNNLSATYVLMNDIDCKGYSFIPIGSNESSAFTGLFDGQGYTIYNFISSKADNVGIFGYNRGIIRNLNVKDFIYNVSAVSNNTVNIGGIVGVNAGIIEQCAAFNGDISATMDNTCRGGLICGYNTGNVLNCFSSGSVYLTHKSSGNKWVTCGGITAGNEGTIDNCCVDATVYAIGYHYYAWGTDAKGEAALISATNEKKGVIFNCLVLGSVTEGNNRQGDICGRNDGTITNCYRDKNVVLAGKGKKFEYATSMSLSNMSSTTFYSVNLGWDSDIWDFTNVSLANKVYPTLKQI